MALFGVFAWFYILKKCPESLKFSWPEIFFYCAQVCYFLLCHTHICVFEIIEFSVLGMKA